MNHNPASMTECATNNAPELHRVDGAVAHAHSTTPHNITLHFVNIKNTIELERLTREGGSPMRHQSTARKGSDESTKRGTGDAGIERR